MSVAVDRDGPVSEGGIVLVCHAGRKIRSSITESPKLEDL